MFIKTVAVLLLFVSVTAQADDEQDCVFDLQRAAAKYRSCHSKYPAGKLGFSTCNAKYAAAWPKLTLKYPGTSCDAPRFVDNGDGTVTDNLTRLIWEKKNALDATPDAGNPHDVDNTCSASTDGSYTDGTCYTVFLADLNSPTCFAGQCDWRLPSSAELTTILSPDPACSSPCIDPAFGATSVAVVYATSSTVMQSPDTVLAINFFNGNLLNTRLKMESLHVRAVHAGGSSLVEP